MEEPTDPEDLRRVVLVYYFVRDRSVIAEWIDGEGRSRNVIWRMGVRPDRKLIFRSYDDFVTTVIPMLSTMTGKRFKLCERLGTDGSMAWVREDFSIDPPLLRVRPDPC